MDEHLPGMDGDDRTSAPPPGPECLDGRGEPPVHRLDDRCQQPGNRLWRAPGPAQPSRRHRRSWPSTYAAARR
jgi:hypothetical protein